VTVVNRSATMGGDTGMEQRRATMNSALLHERLQDLVVVKTITPNNASASMDSETKPVRVVGCTNCKLVDVGGCVFIHESQETHAQTPFSVAYVLKALYPFVSAN
jgi:hypothetical protein